MLEQQNEEKGFDGYKWSNLKGINGKFYIHSFSNVDVRFSPFHKQISCLRVCFLFFFFLRSLLKEWKYELRKKTKLTFFLFGYSKKSFSKLNQ